MNKISYNIVYGKLIFSEDHKSKYCYEYVDYVDISFVKLLLKGDRKHNIPFSTDLIKISQFERNGKLYRYRYPL